MTKSKEIKQERFTTILVLDDKQIISMIWDLETSWRNRNHLINGSQQSLLFKDLLSGLAYLSKKYSYANHELQNCLTALYEINKVNKDVPNNFALLEPYMITFLIEWHNSTLFTGKEEA